MNRQQRRQLAEETMRILDTGGYVASGGHAVRFDELDPPGLGQSRLWTPHELEELCGTARTSHGTRPAHKASVVNQTTLDAAMEMAQGTDRHVACLNFASAKNAGGGFLSGAQAQEESLARASGLYPTLVRHPEYYDSNRHCGTALYTDHLIVSEGVPVFRDDRGDLLDVPYHVTFITSPAPNAGAARGDRDRVPETFRRRIQHVLAVAATLKADDLVLGAWGCGVFRNDPADVAALFAEALSETERFATAFERVVFAVLDRSAGQPTITPFIERFGAEA